MAIALVAIVSSQSHATAIRITDEKGRAELMAKVGMSFQPAVPNQCFFTSYPNSFPKPGTPEKVTGYSVEAFSRAFYDENDAFDAKSAGTAEQLETRYFGIYAYSYPEGIFLDDVDGTISITADNEDPTASSYGISFYFDRKSGKVSHAVLNTKGLMNSMMQIDCPGVM